MSDINEDNLPKFTDHYLQDPLSKNERERLEFILNEEKFEQYVGDNRSDALDVQTIDKNTELYDQLHMDGDEETDLEENEDDGDEETDLEENECEDDFKFMRRGKFCDKLSWQKPLKGAILAKKLGKKEKLGTKRSKKKSTVVSSKLRVQKKLPRSCRLETEIPFPQLPKIMFDESTYKNAVAEREDLAERLSTLQEEINYDNTNFNTESINNLRMRCEKNAKHIKRVQHIMKKLVNSLDNIRFDLNETDMKSNPSKVNTVKTISNRYLEEKSRYSNGDKKQTSNLLATISDSGSEEMDNKITSFQKIDLELEKNGIDATFSESEFDAELDELETLEEEVSSIIKKYSNSLSIKADLCHKNKIENDSS